MKATVVTVVVALLWLGMLVGVAFIATPVKFRAPSLALPVALDVGRQTFALFSRVEVALALALLAPAVFAGRSGPILAAVALSVLVALQILWLLPALDARVAVILAGGTPPSSSLHWVYIAFDAAKLALLAGAAWAAAVAGAAPPP